VRNKYLILALIIILASILRLYKLGDIPRGLYIDEPSLGYNAWSIMQTGTDEYGVPLPLAFQAFGEYKLPGYIYGSLPFIALFGLNAFSIRLLSALAGILGVWGIYLLTQKLLNKDKHKGAIALMAALLFAITPWSIQLSRAAFEANLALTLSIWGIYFLLTWIETKKTHTGLITLLFLVSAFYTYNSARLVVPLVILAMAAIYWKNIPKKKAALLAVISILLMLPGIYGSTLGVESARVRSVFELENKQYMLGPALGVIQKYLTQFSTEFLFFFGDFSARHSVHEMGLLLLPLILLTPLGIYLALRRYPKEAALLIAWLLIAPLPAALASPVPHALRSLNMLPPLIIFAALAVTALYDTRAKNIYKYAALTLVTITTTYAFTSYLHVYYRHYAYKTSWDWNENDTLLGEYLAKTYPNTHQAVVIESDPKNLIYIKFFNAQQGRTVDTTKYLFVKNIPEEQLQGGEIVAINGWKGTPEHMQNVQELKMLNNSIGYKVGEWRKE
jgi:4-amino-4-deoxy-L-arabinose transferase-like glycosyltransferase